MKLCGPANAALAILEAPSYFGGARKPTTVVAMVPAEDAIDGDNSSNVEPVAHGAFFAQSVDLGE